MTVQAAVLTGSRWERLRPRSVAEHAGFRVIGVALGRAIVLGMTILMARRLGADDFGRYGFVVAWLAFFRLFAAFGLVPILVREFVRQDPSNDDRLLRTALTMKFALTLMSMAAAIAAMAAATHDLAMITAAAIGALSLVSVLGDVHMSHLQARNRLHIVTIGETIQLGVWGAGGIAAVQMGGGVPAILGALAAGHAAQFGYYVLASGSDLRLRLGFERIVAIRLARQALPLLLMGAFSVIQLRFDVLVMQAYRPQEEVGWYSAALRVAEPWILVAAASTAAIYPHLCAWRSSQPQNFERAHRASYKYLFAFILPVTAMGALLARPMITAVFGEPYAPAAHTLALLMCAQLFVFLQSFTAYLLIAAGENIAAAVFAVVTGFVFVGMNLLLVPRYGMEGAAISNVISYGVYVVLQFTASGSRALAAGLVTGWIRPAAAAAVCGLVVVPLRHHLGLALAAGAASYLATLLLVRGIDMTELRFLVSAGKAEGADAR